ncbi:MAG: alpha-(1-_3)-arabinofuranosyltransferase family protein [Actinomycetia bacterium]|nr:alpha-(1->3)-arabinofuranosyltransferase family protein [Actinomycetes bacterium]
MALSGLLAVVVLANSWGIFTPDTKPEIFAQPAETASRYALAWIDSPSLGAANYNAGVAPLAALFAIPDAVGIPTWIIMRLWRLSLLIIAAWGARLALRELAGGSLSSNSLAVAAVGAAMAYTLNPYVISGGGTTPTLQPYAFLPWLVVFWLRGFRSSSWRWVVLAALTLAAMGGLNAGVVPILQLVVIIPLVVHAVVVEHTSLRTVALVILRTGLLYVALSAYWLFPALLALGAGTAVAEGTESMAVINTANSFAEVLRGLGMWTLYGADGSGPFTPSHLSYLTSPLVIFFSFGIPVLAGIGVRLSHNPARLFAATSTLLAVLLMVGTFHAGQPTAWSRTVAWSVDNLPAVVAFRTTNKIGGLLELGLAVLVGLAAAALVPRLIETWQRIAAAIIAGGVAAASFAPALTGRMFPIEMDLPDHWVQAADTVDARGGDSRVLMVPGAGAPNYEWGYRSPDEIGPALFTRPFVFRTIYPSGGEHAATLLAEIDRRLRLGTLPAGTISAAAAYLGIGDVVSRYGLVSSDVNPARVEAQLDADPGLAAAEIFDDPDDVTAAAVARSVSANVGQPPMRLGSGEILIVDGTGAALPGLVAAGLVQDRPPLLLSPALTDEQLGQAIADGGRLVLTDANQRREWSNTQGGGVGPLLADDSPLESTRARFEASAQTTARLVGNVSAVHEGQHEGLGLYGYGGIEQAFDGDPTTAWRFGHFQTGAGHTAVITPHEPMVMGQIGLTPAQRSANWITHARVTAHLPDETFHHDIEFSQWASMPTVIELPPEPVSRLEIEVLAVAGDGNAPVGFSEIAIPGVELDRVVTVSTDLSDRLEVVAERSGVNLDDIPMDIVFERTIGDVAGWGVEESTLRRSFTVPVSRTFQASGSFRLAPSVPDAAIDDLLGAAREVRAQSSSRRGNLATHRASMALDSTNGSPDVATGWSPHEPVVGEWIVVDFPRQEITEFTITQPEDGGQATRVWVSVDDGQPFEADLGPGESTVMMPEPTEAGRVRIMITEWNEQGRVTFTDLGLPRIDSGTPPARCRLVGWLGSTPLHAQVGPHIDALLEGGSVPLEPCRGNEYVLESGQHVLDGAGHFAIDLLHLTDNASAAPASAPAELDVVSYQPDSMSVTVSAGCDPCWLSSGQSFDPRWTAEHEGQSLGPPVIVDGFAAGWRLAAQPGDVVQISFGPRGAGEWAWFVSIVAAAICLGVLGIASVRHRTRVRAERPEPSDGEARHE